MYAEENGLFFKESSAKTAANVNDIFYEIGLFLSLFAAEWGQNLIICYGP